MFLLTMCFVCLFVCVIVLCLGDLVRSLLIKVRGYFDVVRGYFDVSFFLPCLVFGDSCVWFQKLPLGGAEKKIIQ